MGLELRSLVIIEIVIFKTESPSHHIAHLFKFPIPRLLTQRDPRFCKSLHHLFQLEEKDSELHQPMCMHMCAYSLHVLLKPWEFSFVL